MGRVLCLGSPHVAVKEPTRLSVHLEASVEKKPPPDSFSLLADILPLKLQD